MLRLLPSNIKMPVVLSFLLIFLTGCGQQAQIDEQIRVATEAAERQFQQLGKALSAGNISNAHILRAYADGLGNSKPQLAPLAEALSRDAGTSGPMYLSLRERLEEAKNPQYYGNWEIQLEELKLIEQAANMQLYNDALSDPINVLADLSDGELARVNAVSRDTSMALNKSADNGPGSQLVGNPQYGQWRTGSNGLSFWEWYGMYSLFSAVGRGFGFGAPSYHTWASNRDYSYHHDYGRRTYSSRNQRTRQATLENRTRKTFNSQGKRFQSPYAKSRTGSSSLSRKSVAHKSSFSRSGVPSSLKTSSSGSRYSSNFRSGYSRSSRGFSGGK